jgi:hypothetical protein
VDFLSVELLALISSSKPYLAALLDYGDDRAEIFKQSMGAGSEQE